MLQYIQREREREKSVKKAHVILITQRGSLPFRVGEVKLFHTFFCVNVILECDLMLMQGLFTALYMRLFMQYYYTYITKNTYTKSSTTNQT